MSGRSSIIFSVLSENLFTENGDMGAAFGPSIGSMKRFRLFILMSMAECPYQMAFIPTCGCSKSVLLNGRIGNLLEGSLRSLLQNCLYSNFGSDQKVTLVVVSSEFRKTFPFHSGDREYLSRSDFEGVVPNCLRILNYS